MHDEMDILREVGSISAGKGSIALSEMLGKRINIKLPSLEILPGGTMINKLLLDRIVISVSCDILTGIKGNIIFLMDEKSAFKLIDLCYNMGEEDKKSGQLTEMGLSLIKEVGNVVVSSYLGALGMMLKIIIIPSIPTMISGPIQQIMNMLFNPIDKNDYVLLIQAIFEEHEHKLNGSFYLALTPTSVKLIQEGCKKLLESLN
ncbi:MAG: chemotaxis protein CheC [Candidatus Omnitrophota bacterium]|nr:chemotaxis protein CheC [Candidatus Omnitrophota bacterium]MBU1929471.1 chemotaxis protein CheC [Candidatus Omnitrophota bacterium]MBU2034932.1 chemotaxis protein CheC [Candidatus Omnitrophota bacterium]MBU2222184.1 chemotaxis protein CheC [Candidatus Omnitrophota bacterium]